MLLRENEEQEWVKKLRSEGKKLVVTNGCFDLLHSGHTSYLEEASNLGDVLLVGCNSDRSVRELKGSTRPINAQEDRAAVLLALRSVDAVYIYDEKDACNFLELTKPDIYVKGGDYSDNWEKKCPVAMKERAIVEKHGGTVKLLSLLEGKSTTALIKKITNQLTIKKKTNNKELKKKIKLVHLLTHPNDEREEKSIESLSSLSEFGVDYVQHINKPYTRLPPKDTCRYPNRVGMTAGYYIRTPGAYGCYSAHKRAVLEEFNSDIDFLLVCECDCVMLPKPKEFHNELLKICNTLEREEDIVYVNLGEDGHLRTRNVKEVIDDSLSIVDKTINSEGVFYQKSSIGIVKEKFLNCKWDAFDLWQQEVFINHRKAYSKTPITTQLEGQSLIFPTTNGFTTHL
jgi:glycerol-3-phosphate cytidylyltransferase